MVYQEMLRSVVVVGIMLTAPYQLLAQHNGRGPQKPGRGNQAGLGPGMALQPKQAVQGNGQMPQQGMPPQAMQQQADNQGQMNCERLAQTMITEHDTNGDSELNAAELQSALSSLLRMLLQQQMQMMQRMQQTNAMNQANLMQAANQSMDSSRQPNFGGNGRASRGSSRRGGPGGRAGR